MEINGKVYRNLEGQVGYLTEKYDDLQDQIIDVRAQIPSKMIVEELPEVGDPLITYYVGPKGTEPNQYYEVWVWVQEEPDGPFVWRELEDTDQVDLSGYLEKQTAATIYGQIYAKTAAGEQAMRDYGSAVSGGMIVQRDGSGGIQVPDSPAGNSYATSKKYVDDNFLAKQTGTREYWQAYMVDTSGNQQMVNSRAASALPDSIATRTSTGQLIAADPTSDDHLTTRRYVNNNYLSKQTGSTSYSQVYTKNANGTQGMANVVNDSGVAYSIVQRNANGEVIVPYTPLTTWSAVSKGYLNDVVGQLLYLHDLEIIITVDATNKLYVKAYLVNGSATAITSFDRILYQRIDVQWGAFGPDMANVEPVAVSKLPDTFRQDEFDAPFVGFLYQYISGGTLISGKTNSSMTTTITDTVISW